MIDFHFVVGKSFFERLKVSASAHHMTMSGFCRRLLEMGLARFEQKFWARGNRRSKWRALGDKQKRVHVFVDDMLYFRLMKLHMDCNFYSMAQVVRKVLAVVLSLVQRFGFAGAAKFLKDGFEKNKKNRYTIGCKSDVRQLHWIAKLKTEFSKKYEPIFVEFY